MKGRYLLVIALLIAGVTATLLQRPIAAAPATDVVSTYVTEPLPLQDPTASLWDRAIGVEVPLGAQSVTLPLNPVPSIKSLRVRSLNDGRQIAFLLEWADGTKDVGTSYNTYQDAVALQFPRQGGQPFICMGLQAQGQGVQILLWRADFQNDVEQEFPTIQNLHPGMRVNVYPGEGVAAYMTARAAGNPIAEPKKSVPVEELTAEGFGTLETQQQNNATGWGTWKDGTWRVVIARPLKTGDTADAQLSPGGETSLAVAAWDGTKQEVDGKKAVSSWLTLKVQGVGPLAALPPMTVGVWVVLLALAAVLLLLVPRLKVS